MKPAYKNPYKYEYKSPYMNTRPLQKPVVHQKKQRAKNNVSLFHRCISLSILLALGLCVIPKSYNNFVKPVYNSFKKDLIGSSVDIADLYNPTSNIVYNDIIGNKRVLMTPSKKHLYSQFMKQMKWLLCADSLNNWQNLILRSNHLFLYGITKPESMLI